MIQSQEGKGSTGANDNKPGGKGSTGYDARFKSSYKKDSKS
jgi:hypothetical protein